MPRDLYARPPSPAHSGAITRRALLRLRPPPEIRDPGAVAAVREAIATTTSRPGVAAFRCAIEPVRSVLADVAGTEPGARVLEVGSAEELAHEAGSFDAVISAFGLAMDPEPDRAVAELARVAAPGGVVAITAWVPRGLPGRLTEFAEDLAPLPPGVPSPAEWGRADVATRRLERLLSGVQVRTRTIRLCFADPDSAFTAISAPLPFPESRLGELRLPFDRLLASCNDSLDRVEIAGRYLVAVGRA